MAATSHHNHHAVLHQPHALASTIWRRQGEQPDRLSCVVVIKRRRHALNAAWLQREEIAPAGSLQAVLHKAMRTPPTSKTTPPAVRPPTVPSLLPSLPEVSKSFGRMPMNQRGRRARARPKGEGGGGDASKQSASLGKIGQ